MKGDREKCIEAGRVGLHRQAGRHRAAAVAAAGLAVPVERAAPAQRDDRADVGGARARAAARGGLPPLRLRLPRLRADARCGGASRNVMQRRRCATISALQERGAARPRLHGAASRGVSVNVTAMFRDPAFFLAFRATGRAAAADLSRSSASGTPAARRRGGLLAGDPAPRGGALRRAAASTPPT